MHTFAGMVVSVSPHVMVPPKGKPYTDDMRAMVDHFHTLGLIRRVPGAIEIAGRLMVHPQIYDAMRKASR